MTPRGHGDSWGHGDGRRILGAMELAGGPQADMGTFWSHGGARRTPRGHGHARKTPRSHRDSWGHGDGRMTPGGHEDLLRTWRCQEDPKGPTGWQEDLKWP